MLNVGNNLLFQKALASYIRKFAYSNAKTEDLWAVLEEKSGEPVKSMMTTWTKQQGYPVINAKLKGNYLELEQVFIIHCPSCVIFAFINMCTAEFCFKKKK